MGLKLFGRGTTAPTIVSTTKVCAIHWRPSNSNSATYAANLRHCLNVWEVTNFTQNGFLIAIEVFVI
jgi:hypothetical protein